MNHGQFDWRGWLRASLQLSTFFGLTMIALVWGRAELSLKSEFETAQTAAFQSTSNLARLFEDQIVRIIKANDRVLQSLQLSSVNGTLARDFDRWNLEIETVSDVTANLALLDANGRLVASSVASQWGDGVDFSDRDYFKVHRESADAGLFIGKPALGRITGTTLIQLSRALRAPHGEFAGVVIASLNPGKLARFYEAVDLGQDGAISIVGLDGIIRANAGMRVNVVGRSIHGSELLRRLQQAYEGSYVSPGMLDGVTRLISYRLVEGYPLAVWIGRSDQEVFARYRRNSLIYQIVSSGLTLFILTVVVASVRHRYRLERARRKLSLSEALAREKSRELELTLNHMSQGIMMIDPDRRVALINRQAIALLGLPESLVPERANFDDLVEYQFKTEEFGPDAANLDPRVREFIKSNEIEVGVYERTRPNGVVLEVCSTALPDGGYVRTFTDISARKRNEQKIAHMAHHDALTGLANRVLLRDHIEIALRRQRRSGESFALFVIDLDRFKQVNDTLGHRAGDMLLRSVAERLQRCVRDVDIVARLGGDEFAILQAATHGRAGVEVLARRVIEAVSEPYELESSPATVGASIGIARSADSPDIEQLFHNADLALYRVKSEGRNDFRLFEPEMDAAAQARRQMEDDLRRAKGRGEFEIHYQPMFNLATGKIAAVEALLRWNHPARGCISPIDFMPLAEEIGLMETIDSWVLETACAEAALWPGGPVLAVNLSPEKFKRRTLVDAIRRELSKSGLRANRLELEISERIMLQENETNRDQLRALHQLGVRVALDDFGVAHSSLSDLRVFAFDKIKIDQSFIAEMETSPESSAIVAAIASLGRTLGAETTAEGVETPFQAHLARAAGCTQAQGFLFSRPIPAGALRTLLREAEAKQSVA